MTMLDDLFTQYVPSLTSSAAGVPPEEKDVISYITEAALKRGIDPDTAIRVARSEGLGSDWQSGVPRSGAGSHNGRENSWGPFQLYKGGGLGNDMMKDTGLDPADPKNWKQGIDFALDAAREGGWGPWYGAKKVGVTGKMGIGEASAAPSGMLSNVASMFNPISPAQAATGPLGAGVGEVPTPGSSHPKDPNLNISASMSTSPMSGMESFGGFAMNAPTPEAPQEPVGDPMRISPPGLTDDNERARFDQLLATMRDQGGTDRSWIGPALMNIGGGLIAGGGNTGLGQGVMRAGDSMSDQATRDLAKRKLDIENMPKTMAVQYLADRYVSEEGMEHGKAMQQAFLDVFASDYSKVGERGLKIEYTEDAEGNLHGWQPTKGGPMKKAELPEGHKWAPGVEWRSFPTEDVAYDRRSGRFIKSTPKDVAGAARMGEEGKAHGGAIVDLSKVRSNAQSVRKMIDEVRVHPYLSKMTGANAYLPTFSGEGKDVLAKVDQLGGKAFLEAFQAIKGAGQITEIEGQKATQALTRLLEMKVGDERYIEALNDFAHEVDRLVQLAEQRASGSWHASPDSSAGGAPEYIDHGNGIREMVR